MDIQRFFDRFRTSSKDPRLYAALGEALVLRLDTTYGLETDPYGKAWEPVITEEENKKILIETGRLRNSLEWLHSGGTSLEIGTNVEYGEYHQDGIGLIARPFLPDKDDLPFSMTRAIKSTIAAYYRRLR